MNQFGHEKLDVYKLSLVYVSYVYKNLKKINSLTRNLRDQWIRASTSVVLNIAEGNGKSSVADRKRFFEISRGSALECVAIQDILTNLCIIDEKTMKEGKEMIFRIVSMLSKMR